MRKLLLITILSCFALWSCKNEPKRIAIIGAMDIEIASLKEVLENPKETIIAGIPFYTGKLKGKDVVIFRSGEGKVNSAMATTIAIGEFNVEQIIFTGVAGSVKNEINIADIVISTDLVHHDYDTTVFGNAPGLNTSTISGSIKASEALINIAQSVAIDVMGSDKVHLGTIATGDQFIADKNKVAWIDDTFNAYAVEMEGAAVAQVAKLYGVPFVVLRAMSDKADGTAHMDYEDFKIIAAENSVNIVLGMLERL